MFPRINKFYKVNSPTVHCLQRKFPTGLLCINKKCKRSIISISISLAVPLAINHCNVRTKTIPVGNINDCLFFKQLILILTFQSYHQSNIPVHDLKNHKNTELQVVFVKEYICACLKYFMILT